MESRQPTLTLSADFFSNRWGTSQHSRTGIAAGQVRIREKGRGAIEKCKWEVPRLAAHLLLFRCFPGHWIRSCVKSLCNVAAALVPDQLEKRENTILGQRETTIIFRWLLRHPPDGNL